MQQIIYRTDKM